MHDSVIISSPRGHLRSLQEILLYAQLRNISPVNTYVLGDLIDIGPDSKQIIQLCMNRGYRVIRGNHEKYMIEAMNAWKDCKDYNAITKWAGKGGVHTVRSYDLELPDFFKKENYDKVNNCGIMEHVDYLSRLPLCVELDNYYLSHAGIPTKKSEPKECTEDDLTESTRLNWSLSKRQIINSGWADGTDIVIEAKNINMNIKQHVSAIFMPSMENMTTTFK